MKRREFLTIPAAALGGTLLYTLSREPLRLQAQTGGKTELSKSRCDSSPQKKLELSRRLVNGFFQAMRLVPAPQKPA